MIFKIFSLPVPSYSFCYLKTISKFQFLRSLLLNHAESSLMYLKLLNKGKKFQESILIVFNLKLLVKNIEKKNYDKMLSPSPNRNAKNLLRFLYGCSENREKFHTTQATREVDSK